MHGAFTPQASACVLRQSNDIQPRHNPQDPEFGHLPQPLPNTAWLREPALWQQQRHACAALAGHAGNVFAAYVTYLCSGKEVQRVRRLSARAWTAAGKFHVMSVTCASRPFSFRFEM
jgi:hypothetical protein